MVSLLIIYQSNSLFCSLINIWSKRSRDINFTVTLKQRKAPNLDESEAGTREFFIIFIFLSWEITLITNQSC